MSELSGKDYMVMGKEDLIFKSKSFHKDGFCYLEITDMFKRCWQDTIKGNNYQKDFDTFVAKALALHYERVLKIQKKDWNKDRMSGIGVLLCKMKGTLFEGQMKITLFDEEE